jgi:steroid delta-isomerase-like uncharacterized protein
MKENEEVLREWFQKVWNEHNREAIFELFVSSGDAHGLRGTGRNAGAQESGGSLKGPEEFAPLFDAFVNAFPNINVEIEEIFSSVERVVARCRVRGTHEGDGLGLPATGKSVDFSGISIARIADGRIVEAWNCYDFLTMYRQLGAGL